MGVTIDDARAIVAPLPRSYEALVRDRVKFRVGQIVYAAFSRDETIMGFAFPREEREALVASEPDKFLMPRPFDMRYRWVCVRLDAIDGRSCSSTRGACAYRRRWLPPMKVDHVHHAPRTSPMRRLASPTFQTAASRVGIRRSLDTPGAPVSPNRERRPNVVWPRCKGVRPTASTMTRRDVGELNVTGVLEADTAEEMARLKPLLEGDGHASSAGSLSQP
jgi:hypothetical protein